VTRARDYEVGKGKPPKDTRFSAKRQPAKRRRGKKAGPFDVAAFFEEPMVVTIDGESKKLHPLAVMLTKLVERVIKNGDMRAAARFLDHCASVDLLVDPNAPDAGPTVYQISWAWTYEDWIDRFRKLGPPPWPGARNGLFNRNWREEVLAS
jgi:hypothetical protein